MRHRLTFYTPGLVDRHDLDVNATLLPVFLSSIDA
jgi:hypothetical protein